MKIKSAKFFREKYMTDIRHVLPNTGYDPSFVGCSHQLTDGTYTKGFFDLYHGDKQKVGDFLSSFLKTAEDGQAIYEFLQNAADCNSTLFYMFYNEKYFLAVNNGEVFNQEGLRSLLNIAQSTKSSSSQIGRLGIGFKLVHRLVGKGDGKKELTQDYKGPIMFSWNNKSDLLSLMNHEIVEPVNNIEDDSNLPYLLKLILTNFPAEPQEIAKDLNYEDRVLFDAQEYEELCTIVKESLLPYINVDNLNQGTLFFIRLGDGKKNLLDKDYEQNFRVGVEYSLNTLKGLNNVKINGTKIERVPLQLENGVILKDSETFNRIDPEYKDDDIHFSIGYNKIDFASEDPFVKVEALKKSPTFYKYFPLGDEIHQSAIFIHCDSISNEANRRKMHEDPINKELIPEIAQFIVEKLRSSKASGNIEAFCQLYANLLLSDVPHDNSDWLKELYYDIIQNYLVTCIPTIDGYADDAFNVKIKRITTNIPLSVVNDSLQWFKWNDKNVDTIINSAKSKLGIQNYDIVDIIVDSDVEKINSWIATASNSDYSDFLDEINSTSRLLTSNFINKIRKIRLFKFSDNNFYSYDELVKYEGGHYVFASGKTIYLTKKTEKIKEELFALGFVMSNVNLNLYQKIKECFILPKDKRFFTLLQESVVNAELSKSQKKKLITHLSTQDVEKKLDDVGKESIQSLQICHNNAGELLPLCDLIGRKYTIPEWLSAYQIKEEDYFVELDKFLMSEQNVYSSVIYNYWDDILVYDNVNTFYEEVVRLYNLDAEHNKTLKGKKYIYTEDNEYVSLEDLIYNTKMLNESLDYKSLNNVITTIFGRKLPNKDIATILEVEPFGIKNENICDWIPISENGVGLDDIQNLLKFCTLNNETFFKEFLISFKDHEYFIERRGDNYYQVYTRDSLTKSYINNNYCGAMILLPNGLEEYKDSDGIVSGARLQSSILAGVDDTDANKEELIDIVKYEARKEFIIGLSEIKIDLDEDTSDDSFSYKLLDMATKVLEDADSIEDFRNKLIIEKEGVSYSHDQIPQSVAESFEVEGAKKKFDLSKILPNENENGSLLIEIAEKYSMLGIQRSKLNELFGISEDTDVDNLYNTLIANYETLQNEQQLAFVLQMCTNKGITPKKFKLTAINGEDYEGEFVVKSYDFISESYILSKSYAHLKDYIELPYDNDSYIETPYINDESMFICPGIDTTVNDEISFEKVICLLSFLEKKYKRSTEKIKNVDWSIMKKELGFNPVECVFPKKYALESETLPTEVEKWIKESEVHKDFIQALGVLIEKDPVLKFRKFINGELSTFEVHSLYSVECKEDLENSLKWLSEKSIFPLSKEKFDAILVSIEQINKLRGPGKIVATDKFDIGEIDNNSIEYSGPQYSEWKEETGYSIYEYEGALPHIVEIDEYIESPLYSYNEGNVTDNGDCIIYVNKESDIQDSLHHLAENNKIGLTREEVYKLFNRSIVDLQNEIKRLREANQKLREGLPVPTEDVVMGGGESTGPDEKERPEWNELARKKIKKKLEAEGYKFTQGIGNYSDIPGVIDPDGNSVHLVVKSCRWGKLSINPIEWGTLLKPNAMLWIFDGHDALPLHLRALIRNQDELVLRIDTRNLDDVSKVSKFAQILQYFKQVHFDFSSVRPTTIASTYKEYAFDDRPMDETLEEDDFE